MRTETINPTQVGMTCAGYVEDGFRLQTMVAADERATKGVYTLRYLFFNDDERQGREVYTELSPDNPTFTSATPLVPAANWYEREAYDLLGLVPVGHPDPRPLILHGDRLAEVYPLRKDFPVDGVLPAVERTMTELHLPEGMFEVPVGPIHAGVIEPGHFRFQMRGETVHALSTTLFYTHRGLEKRAENMSLSDGLALVEQTCGVCSLSHALSYAQAVESLAQVAVPEQARYIRVVWAEMERLYNHIGDVGNICAGIGFSFGTMQAGRLKEYLQRLQARLTGHRYLRGVLKVGGVQQSLTADQSHQLMHGVQAIMAEFAEVADAILSHETACDRFRMTGVLSESAVRSWGAVGPTARASGVARDARLQQAHAAYADLFPDTIPTFVQGDVMARLLQRIEETQISAKLIAQAISHLTTIRETSATTDLYTPLPSVEPYATGIGVSESPRGENVHFVMAGAHGQIERLRIRSASYANWPAVPEAVPGNLIADFPLINKSFELCYACCDR
ncbi:MAG: NADH-quinone oxidoreductase subunit C [Firmicutes bacterium]|nr:NADH-quinone oxidoreductase subunit C [Bacillota bacterium]